jgi:4-amino-4-deoxy-L-arabinose transferase-like glycosyltransferase
VQIAPHTVRSSRSPKGVALSRRLELLLVTLVLLTAAALRIAELTRLPPGFSDKEIVSISLTDMARGGGIASLYNVGGPQPGREGLYPLLQAIVTGIAGEGLLLYRVLSVGSGLLSVALAYALTRRLFGGFGGLVAGIGMAVTLWPVMLARSAIAEAVLLPLVLATLLTLTRALHLRQRIEPDPPLTVTYTVLGILIGTLAYAHWTGLVMLPVLVLFVAYLILTRQPVSRRILGFSAFTVLVILVVSIPYLTFSARAPILSGFSRFWSERPEGVGQFVSGVLKSLASVIFSGDMDVTYNLPGMPLLNPALAALFVIGLGVALRRWRAPNMMLPLLALGVGLLTDAWTRDNPRFAHQIVALPAIMALTGLGAATLATAVYTTWRAQARALLHTGVAVGAVALTAISIWLTGRALFVDWAALPAVDAAYVGRLGHLAAYLDRQQDGLSTAICTFALEGQPLSEAGLTSAALSDRVLLEMMMHSHRPELRFFNCVGGLVLTRGGERQRFAFAHPEGPAAIAQPFMDWLADARPVEVRGLPPGMVFEVDAAQVVADTFGMTILSHVDWAPETAGPSDWAVLPLRMGGYLTFEGYIREPEGPYRPGDTFTLVTYWRADGPQVPGLGLFAHVMRNPYTAPVLQNDVLSIDASLLANRDVFIQLIPITIPPDFPPDEYAMSIGAVSTITGTRLPIYDEDQERGRRLFLSQISIRE